MTIRHKAEQKKLYTQYYNDVKKLQENNAELEAYIKTLGDAIKGLTEEHELEAVQRDYDEFKQPDIDGDDRISRAEFNMYIRDYLSNYPGMKPEDYPRFDDFDHDNDGFISFQEYAEQMALAVQKAEKQQAASFWDLGAWLFWWCAFISCRPYAVTILVRIRLSEETDAMGGRFIWGLDVEMNSKELVMLRLFSTSSVCTRYDRSAPK